MCSRIVTFITLTLSVAALFSASAANAANCDGYAYTTLVNGTTADATQVNGNFNQILGCANNVLAPIHNPVFTGDVGIGTTNPTHSLDITDTTGGASVRLNSASGHNARVSFALADTTLWTIGSDASTNNFTFYDGTHTPVVFEQGAPAQSIHVAASGYVGLGTSSPSALLHLSSASNGYNGGIYLENTTSGQDFSISSRNDSGAPARFSIADETNHTERFVIDSSGKVGIGTNAPTAILTVNGGIQAVNGNSISSAGGYVGWNGTNTGTSSVCYFTYATFNWAAACGSRSEWKKNQESLGIGLDTLMKLRPVEFDWDKKHGGEHDLGFIAQEVEKVDPLLATYEVRDGKHQLIGVKYRRMTALLTKAVQEQQAEIAAQKAEIESLRRANAAQAKAATQSQAQHASDEDALRRLAARVDALEHAKLIQTSAR